jgi:hypothetical protein
MQAAQDKQMEKLMELFTKSMEAMKKVNSPAPTQTPSGGGGGTRTMKPKCPHCNI